MAPKSTMILGVMVSMLALASLVGANSVDIKTEGDFDGTSTITCEVSPATVDVLEMGGPPYNRFFRWENVASSAKPEEIPGLTLDVTKAADKITIKMSWDKTTCHHVMMYFCSVIYQNGDELNDTERLVPTVDATKPQLVSVQPEAEAFREHMTVVVKFHAMTGSYGNGRVEFRLVYGGHVDIIEAGDFRVDGTQSGAIDCKNKVTYTFMFNITREMENGYVAAFVINPQEGAPEPSAMDKCDGDTRFCEKTDMFHVHYAVVEDAVSIEVNPAWSVLQGQSVKFICHAESNPTPTIEWSRNNGTDVRRMGSGELVTAGNVVTSSLTIPAVDSEKDPGRYMCRAENMVWGKKYFAEKIINFVIGENMTSSVMIGDSTAKQEEREKEKEEKEKKTTGGGDSGGGGKATDPGKSASSQNKARSTGGVAGVFDFWKTATVVLIGLVWSLVLPSLVSQPSKLYI